MSITLRVLGNTLPDHQSARLSMEKFLTEASQIVLGDAMWPEGKNLCAKNAHFWKG